VYTLIGRGGVQVGLFHTALDLLSITLLYHIGRRLFTPDGEWIGTLAGVCYALYPYLVFQNLTLIDTPLFMVILFAFLLVMISLRERPTYDRATFGYALLGGVILG
jgi:4-amino-4-deoxy-L-arabinose transferase-like glycosyltransferase